MKGDFTRVTFDPSKHFTRVLMQQGRVQLDADWNEQTAILLHYLRALAADLIGPFGGSETSFEIFTDHKDVAKGEKELLPLKEGDFLIRGGHYYVDGLLCESEGYARYSDQVDLRATEPPLHLDSSLHHLAYLDVWERHVTYFEDDAIREAALGGQDTATRTKIVWQVKALTLNADDIKPATKLTKATITKTWKEDWVKRFEPQKRGLLKANIRESEVADLTKPCLTPPDMRYRGAENQLYRVEIHKSGMAGSATFKWSRENGSIVFPIVHLEDNVVTLAHLGRDERLGLKVGDYAEVITDEADLGEDVSPLVQVDAIDSMELTVRLKVPAKVKMLAVGAKDARPLYLRRWDHEGGDLTNDGALPVVESKELLLEDGVQIEFEADGASYRRGDYWLIPARTATGDVEWPKDSDGKPQPQMPHGIEHHYAPLAVLSPDKGKLKVEHDCRSKIKPLAS